jgi:hypothetical protein
VAAKLLGTILFAPGSWTTDGARTSFTLSRDHRTYAHGTIAIHHGRISLPALRHLHRGNYRLTITTNRDGHRHTLTDRIIRVR